VPVCGDNAARRPRQINLVASWREQGQLTTAMRLNAARTQQMESQKSQRTDLSARLYRLELGALIQQFDRVNLQIIRELRAGRVPCDCLELEAADASAAIYELLSEWPGQVNSASEDDHSSN
jgi:hypothetical protein